MLEILKKSLLTCPMVKREKDGVVYNYFINPITDGIPAVTAELLRDVTAAMLKSLDLKGVDKIVVSEAMGIHIGTALTLATGIPFVVIRKREYRLPGEVVIGQETGYSKGTLYMNYVNKGDRVVIIDDVISTGGTIKGILPALKIAGAELVDILFVVNRGSPDIGIPYKTLVTIDVDENGVKIIDSAF